MCGRFACPLAPDDLSCAASYKNNSTGTFKKPPCIFDFKSFNPSYNIPPTTSALVIISTEHRIHESSVDSDRVIIPMRFGVIPHWLSPEDVKPGKLETHLCTFERMLSSKLYKPILDNGGRCIIPCSGYYEWQSTKGSNRQPFFFYNKENCPNELTKVKGKWDVNSGWQGIKLLFLAGIFNSYKNSKGDKQYSFAIITKEAGEDWNWVHHRMPVVLQSEEDIYKWLHIKTIPLNDALKSISCPITNLKTHPVDRTKINSTKNNTPKCVEEMSIKKPVSKLMSSWLNSEKNQTNEINTNVTKCTKKEAKLAKQSTSSKTIMENFLFHPSKKRKIE